MKPIDYKKTRSGDALRRLSRRNLLRYGLVSAGALAFGNLLGGYSAIAASRASNIANLGPLQDPDANGLKLPRGFRSRIVARSGEFVAGTSYLWHGAPDGGAVFATNDGGWIYVSNSELDNGAGGVSALRFDEAGAIVSAYQICADTNRNCAGGTTPWGTWLSCEEVNNGLVWECDPFGQRDQIAWPALGVFNHEAVCLDTLDNRLYLTEDRGDGGFYRFTSASLTSDGHPDLSAGTLDIAEVDPTGKVLWNRVPDPSAATTPTRKQVPATRFAGGEGIWYHNGTVYFATKGDNRVWAFNVATQQLDLLYDAGWYDKPVLTGVDNLTVIPHGDDVIVGEDGGDMQVVALTPQGRVIPIVQVVGHRDSEVTGPAFTPDGTRLYFSSQRGEAGLLKTGITFEVTGPFVV